MSKRLFAEVDSNNSPGNATSVSQILNHAKNLLKTVKALNEELQKFHDTSDINDEIVSVLKRHNNEILPTAQLLAQDEVSIEPSGAILTANSRSPRQVLLVRIVPDRKKPESLKMGEIPKVHLVLEHFPSQITCR